MLSDTHDLVAGRGSDSHGPAEMMGDPHTHALKYLVCQAGPQVLVVDTLAAAATACSIG